MSALAFWKAVVADRSNFLERVVALLAEHEIRYCVIGGVGVNAYAEPVVTQDLDIVVAVDQLETAKQLLAEHFRVREFPHSFNAYDPDSKLQVQLQLHPGVEGAVGRAAFHEVMDLRLPVAEPEDLVRLKVDAALDETCRASTRQKDLADIARLLEAFPELRSAVPASLLDRLFL